MRLSLFVILAFSVTSSLAQIELPNKIKFAEHLVNQEYFEDAIYYIESITKNKESLFYNDTLNYLKGWSYYSLKELDKSAQSLLHVPFGSAYFYKSRFFAAYNKSHLGIIPTSNYLLFNLLESEKYEGLKTFQLAGNALLERDLNKFDGYYFMLQGNGFAYSQEKLKLFDCANEIKKYHKKSSLAAGILSAIVPGSGKIYAGKTGEGIASFIIVGAAGLTALENYNKLGAKHAKTILFSSLFSVLYIGNIYGSVFTVKLVNEEFNHAMDHKILFNMHIPLRNIFN